MQCRLEIESTWRIFQLPSLPDNSKVTVVASDSDRNVDGCDGTDVDQIW